MIVFTWGNFLKSKNPLILICCNFQEKRGSGSLLIWVNFWYVILKFYLNQKTQIKKIYIYINKIAYASCKDQVTHK